MIPHWDLKNFRNFKRANVKEMIRDMNLLDCNGNSLDEVLTSFNNNAQKALDKHALEKRVKLSLKNLNCDIMMT